MDARTTRPLRLGPAILAAMIVPLPIVLWNPEFAVTAGERVELFGGSAAALVMAGVMGTFVGRWAGRRGAAAWWFAWGWLAAVTAIVGWIPYGPLGVAAAGPIVLVGVLCLRGRVFVSTTALLAATVVSTALVAGRVLLEPQMRPPDRQVVLIGLDAATWKIIDSLRAAGRMPTFEALLQIGARADLDVLFPIISPPLWTSIATGQRPDKHGIKDFWGGSRQVRSKRIWDVVDERGGLSGVVGYLVTWPPDKASGVLVPGWDAQGIETVPPELGFLKELEIGEKQGAEVALLVRLRQMMIALRHGLTLSTVNLAASGVIARRLGRQRPLDYALEGRLLKLGLYTDVFCHLLRTMPMELASFYYSSIDAISHEFFKYYAPAGFPGLPAAQIAEFQDAIPRVYEASDAAIARILRWVDPSAYVMIVSDHGQRPVEREGAKWYRIRTTKLVERLGLESKLRTTNVGAGVYLRPTAGPAEYAEGVAALRGIVTVADGRPLFTIRDHGPSEALLEVRDDLGDDDTIEVQVGMGVLPLAEVLDGTERISGEHTETAIFLLTGPGVDGGRTIARGSVLDVAPTALVLLGLPLARDLDGRFLEAALRPEARAGLEITYVDTYGPARHLDATPERIDRDKLENLKALGYVE